MSKLHPDRKRTRATRVIWQIADSAHAAGITVKRTRATRSIWQIADSAHAAVITVDCDSSYSTVSIECPGTDGAFLQGDDADAFIVECEKLWRRYPSLPMDVCELALAEPYSVLWS